MIDLNEPYYVYHTDLLSLRLNTTSKDPMAKGSASGVRNGREQSLSNTQTHYIYMDMVFSKIYSEMNSSVKYQHISVKCG